MEAAYEELAEMILEARNNDDISDEEFKSTIQNCIQNVKCFDMDAITKTIRRTMIQIAEITERNNERRHRQLLKVLVEHLPKDGAQKRSATSTITTNPEEAGEIKRVRMQSYVGGVGGGGGSALGDSQQPVNKIKCETIVHAAAVGDITIEPIAAGGTTAAINSQEKATAIVAPSKVKSLAANDLLAALNANRSAAARQTLVLKHELQQKKLQILELQRQRMAELERKKKKSTSTSTDAADIVNEPKD